MSVKSFLLQKVVRYIPGSFMCLSFHIKKHLKIGKGGMILTDNKLNKKAYFTEPTLDIDVLIDKNSVDLFDQNGYHLTKAEQAYLKYNGYKPIERRHEDCLRYDWLVWDKREGAHINHSDLFERKGFSKDAKQQLLEISKLN